MLKIRNCIPDFQHTGPWVIETWPEVTVDYLKRDIEHEVLLSEVLFLSQSQIRCIIGKLVAMGRVQWVGASVGTRYFLNECGIRFVPYPGAGWADNLFLIESFCQAKAIMTFDEAFYHHRCDLPGATYNHDKDSAVALPFDRWCDMTDILERLHVSVPRILGVAGVVRRNTITHF